MIPKIKSEATIIARAAYVGRGKSADKRYDTKTEGLSLWISPNGIKTFYAFKKVQMFNKEKLILERNNIYKKIFRFEDTTHRNLAAAKDELPEVLRKMSVPRVESNEDITFKSLAKDILKNGTNVYRLADRGEKI